MELPKELVEINLDNLKDIVIKPRIKTCAFINTGWIIYYNFKEKMGYEQSIWVSIILNNTNFEFSYCSNVNGSDLEINTIKDKMNAVAAYLQLLGFKPIEYY